MHLNIRLAPPTVIFFGGIVCVLLLLAWTFNGWVEGTVTAHVSTQTSINPVPCVFVSVEPLAIIGPEANKVRLPMQRDSITREGHWGEYNTRPFGQYEFILFADRERTKRILVHEFMIWPSRNTHVEVVIDDQILREITPLSCCYSDGLCS